MNYWCQLLATFLSITDWLVIDWQQTIGKLYNWKIGQDRPQTNSPEVSESSESSASPSANNFGQKTEQKTEQTANENTVQMSLIEKEKEFIYF